jgi:hypothetical protein
MNCHQHEGHQPVTITSTTNTARSIAATIIIIGTVTTIRVTGIAMSMAAPMLGMLSVL